MVCGNLQLCAVLETDIEGATHAGGGERKGGDRRDGGDRQIFGGGGHIQTEGGGEDLLWI